MRMLKCQPEKLEEYEYYGQIIEEIMYDLVQHCEGEIILTSQLIDITAKSLDLTTKEVIAYLKECKSEFVSNNEIQGFILNKNGKWEYIKRVSLYASIKSMFKKHKKFRKYDIDELAYMLEVFSSKLNFELPKFKF